MNIKLSQEQAKQHLMHFELLDEQISMLKRKHAAVFDKVAALEAERDEIKGTLKRVLVGDVKGPPEGISLKGQTALWAKAKTWEVTVSYPKSADFFDPKKLPSTIFTPERLKKGIITEVNTALVRALSEKDNRVAKALTLGAWLTPRLSVQMSKGGEGL